MRGPIAQQDGDKGHQLAMLTSGPPHLQASMSPATYPRCGSMRPVVMATGSSVAAADVPKTGGQFPGYRRLVAGGDLAGWVSGASRSWPDCARSPITSCVQI